jgi:hypothetical protein
MKRRPKMKQMPPLNIPKIQQEVRAKHEKFIKNLGPQIQKVTADNRLLTDLMATRIYHLLLCFREEGVIDEVKQSNSYPKKLTISKKGFDNYVYVITNGRTIRIEGYNFISDDFKSDVQLPGKNYHAVDDMSYDWDNFAMELLDYIHGSIYDRKEALEVKITGVFDGPPIDEVKTNDAKEK